jgi:hypothetical protein
VKSIITAKAVKDKIVNFNNSLIQCKTQWP